MEAPKKEKSSAGLTALIYEHKVINKAGPVQQMQLWTGAWLDCCCDDVIMYTGTLYSSCRQNRRLLTRTVVRGETEHGNLDLKFPMSRIVLRVYTAIYALMQADPHSYSYTFPGLYFGPTTSYTKKVFVCFFSPAITQLDRPDSTRYLCKKLQWSPNDSAVVFLCFPVTSHPHTHAVRTPDCTPHRDEINIHLRTNNKQA